MPTFASRSAPSATKSKNASDLSIPPATLRCSGCSFWANANTHITLTNTPSHPHHTHTPTHKHKHKHGQNFQGRIPINRQQENRHTHKHTHVHTSEKDSVWGDNRSAHTHKHAPCDLTLSFCLQVYKRDRCVFLCVCVCVGGVFEGDVVALPLYEYE